MDKIFTVAGIALILVGVVVPFPQSVFNAFSVGVPVVSCSGNACNSSVTITNNNATQQAQIWYKVTSGGIGGAAFLSNAVSITTQVGASQTFSQSLGTLACGQYALFVSVIDSGGSIIGASNVSTLFSPCVSLTVDSAGTTVSVSPMGTSTGGQYAMTMSYQTGTSVTLTSTPPANERFACWEYLTGGSGCVASNPLTLTLTKNVEVAATVTTIPGLAYITVIPSAGEGSINPSSAQVVYQTSGGTCQSATGVCPSSVTFTATGSASAGTAFANWFTFQNNQMINLGTSNPITLNYAQASASSSHQTLILAANFTLLDQLNIIDNLSYPGRVTLSAHNSVPVAAPGTTFLPPGTKVTISASGLPTTCSGPSTNGCYYLDGWIVDGVVVDQGQTSVTVTMNGAHGVSPNVVHPATSITGCASGTSTLSVCSTTVVCQTASSSGATTTYGATTIVYTTGSTTCNVISNGTGSGGGSSAGGGTTTTTTGFGPFSIVFVIAGTAIAAFGVSRKKR